MLIYSGNVFFSFPQEELHKAEQEVDNCKRHKKHYEEKLRQHLQGIEKNKRELRVKESDLEVRDNF